MALEKESATRANPRYDSRTQFAFDVLVEMGIATSHAITNIMGEEQAESLVRTEMYHAGLAIALNIKERMALEGSSLVSAAYSVNWIYTIWGQEHNTEITDNGFRDLVKSCPYSRASSALCCHIKYVPAAFSEVYGLLDYESHNSRRLSHGDDCCDIVISRKGVGQGEALLAPCVCEPLPPPLEPDEMKLWNHSYTGSMWTLLLKTMLDEIGSETTLQVLGVAFKDIGESYAGKFKEEYRIDADDLGSVAQGFNLFHSSFLKRGRLVKEPQGFAIITEQCPFSGEPIEACQLFQAFYEGLLCGVNPRFCLRCMGMMSKGDKDCRFRISYIEGDNDRSDVANPNDPIVILSVRFARGEITEEQYERMLSALKRHLPR